MIAPPIECSQTPWGLRIPKQMLSRHLNWIKNHSTTCISRNMVSPIVYHFLPTSTSNARNAVYFSIEFGKLTIDGLIGTRALFSAIHELNLPKIRLLSPQSAIPEDPPPKVQILVANGQLETPKSTIELKFEVGDIEFHEIFMVMENLTVPIIGMMFLQRNHTVLDMRQGILRFPFLSMQLETTNHRYSNVLEPITNSTEVSNPPNDRVLIRTNSLLLSWKFNH